jgi:dTDP-4-amino-4,6-dideoxygalactose transaminase
MEEIEAIQNIIMSTTQHTVFGVQYKGKSIFEFGDINFTCSFHATKLFHTGEGGAGNEIYFIKFITTTICGLMV